MNTTSKKRRIIGPDAVFHICVLAGLLVVWQAGVWIFDVSELLLPAPTAVLRETAKIAPLLLENAGSTVGASLVGFAAAALGGVALGILLVSSNVTEKAVFPLLLMSQTMPKIAVTPLLLIWFGYGMKSKIIVAFLMAFFPVLIDTMVGLRATPNELLLLARSIGACPLTVFRMFRLPYALPYIFGGLRVAAVFAVTGAVVAEFVGAENGLVYLLVVAQSQYQTSVVFGIIALLSILTMLLFGLVELVERRAIPWYHATRAYSV